jgi:hypothetical protein
MRGAAGASCGLQIGWESSGNTTTSAGWAGRAEHSACAAERSLADSQRSASAATRATGCWPRSPTLSVARRGQEWDSSPSWTRKTTSCALSRLTKRSVNDHGRLLAVPPTSRRARARTAREARSAAPRIEPANWSRVGK